MTLHRRDFLKTSMSATLGAGVAASGCANRQAAPEAGILGGLTLMTEGIVPIKDDERWQRIE